MSITNKIETFFNKLDKSEQTKKTYKTRLLKLVNDLNIKSIKSLKDTDKIDNYIKDLKPATQKLFLVPLYQFTKLKYYQDKYLNINKDLFKNQKDNKLTNKEKDNLISYKEFKKLKIKRKENEYKHILLELIKLPFTPRLEYRNIRFGKDDNKNNWIDLENKQIIINDYKTKNKHGKIVYELPTKKIINDLKKHKRFLKDNDYLLGREYSSNVFSKYLTNLMKEVSGKNINNNLLRKIKGNHFINNKKIQKMSLNEKDDFFNKHFQHDYTTAIAYYKKVDI